MIVYADILILNNTMMTYAIIWSLGKILNYDSTWWKLLTAALIGTAYTFLILYINMIIDGIGLKIIISILLNLLTAFMMIYTAFGKLTRREFLQAAGYLYLISFICIGAILSFIYIFGSDPVNNRFNYLLLIPGLVILVIISKNAWRIFYNYIKPESFYINIKIYLNNEGRQIRGLIDTGNSLQDPLTSTPVIVTEVEQILPLFTEDLQHKLGKKKGGVMELIDIFASCDMGNRIRVLPFSALGQERGMLMGFRPDMVELEYKGQVIRKENILLALTYRQLDEDDNYRALVNPRLISEMSF